MALALIVEACKEIEKNITGKIAELKTETDLTTTKLADKKKKFQELNKLVKEVLELKKARVEKQTKLRFREAEDGRTRLREMCATIDGSEPVLIPSHGIGSLNDRIKQLRAICEAEAPKQTDGFN